MSMKTIIRIGFCLLALVTLSGCASSGAYFSDRGRDAMDVFTVTVGVGVGVKARVGPIQEGLLLQQDLIGMRGGTLLSGYDSDLNLDFLLPLPLIPVVSWSSSGLSSISGCESFLNERISPRRKEVDAVASWFLAIPERKNPAFYTQIDVVIGLGPSLRLGFNPGELLDFFLGWFNLDIYDDDMARKAWLEPKDKKFRASR